MSEESSTKLVIQIVYNAFCNNLPSESCVGFGLDLLNYQIVQSLLQRELLETLASQLLVEVVPLFSGVKCGHFSTGTCNGRNTLFQCTFGFIIPFQ